MLLLLPPVIVAMAVGELLKRDLENVHRILTDIVQELERTMEAIATTHLLFPSEQLDLCDLGIAIYWNFCWVTQNCDFDRDFRVNRTKNQNQNNDTYFYAREREVKSKNYIIIGTIDASHAGKKAKKKKQRSLKWRKRKHRFSERDK